VNPSFWAGRRVFVTGHTGFKGAWLGEWLSALGAEVWGYSLPAPTEPSLFAALGDRSLVRSTIGDVANREQLGKAINEAKPEIVLHLAAQALVRASYEDPVGTFATNVLGTVHVLEAVRSTPSVKAVLVVTSDKSYENREWLWGYRETDGLGGRDPYSSSKACAELVTAAYRDSFLAERGVLVATARGGNVIGGGDYAKDRLIPDLLRAFAAGQPASIRNPAATRPWQHVLELLRGYLMLAERLHAGDTKFVGPWNFGPPTHDVRPVSWLADQLAQEWGGAAAWVTTTGAHPHEARALTLDATKATTELGWRPALPLAEALPWIVDFERRQHTEHAADLVRDQIARYEQRCTGDSPA
jgi:CDP-glucose 4,6-dehydratase